MGGGEGEREGRRKCVNDAWSAFVFLPSRWAAIVSRQSRQVAHGGPSSLMRVKSTGDFLSVCVCFLFCAQSADNWLFCNCSLSVVMSIVFHCWNVAGLCEEGRRDSGFESRRGHFYFSSSEMFFFCFFLQSSQLQTSLNLIIKSFENKKKFFKGCNCNLCNCG